MAGCSVERIRVRPRGLAHDRRYLIVDADNRLITQREHSVLATVKASLVPSGLIVDLAGQSLKVDAPPPQGARRKVFVWYNETNALDCGDEAAQWLSDALGQHVRLTYMDSLAERRTEDGETEVSFADNYPVMVANEGSLADLNSRLERPVPMNRFRPNLVVAGFDPWEEDEFKSLSVGGASFSATKNCGRCGVTTIDQQTGEKTGSEPLRTLASYRTIEKQAVFGRYLVPEFEAEIQVGDPVSAIG